MKTIYYNSKLAKLILFGSYHTIMLFGFILTKLNDTPRAESYEAERVVRNNHTP